MLADGEGKQEVRHFLWRRGAFGHTLQLLRLDPAIVPLLEQEAPRQRLEGHARLSRIRQSSGNQHSKVLLLTQHLTRSCIHFRRYHHLHKKLCNLCSRCLVKRTVQSNDAAKGRDGVTLKGLKVCLQQSGSHRHAAGVGVLNDGAGGAVGKLGHQFKCSVGVVQIVVAQLFSLQLCGCCNSWSQIGSGVGIEGCLLVGVLAISQLLPEDARGGEARRKRRSQLLCKPCGNGGIIRSCPSIGCSCKPLPQFRGCRTLVLLHLCKDISILCSIRKDHYRLMVF
mmetsp:Transcript_6450/g.10018  ORF Transcript_6450/g.10018 Transcript_6450/m.10018 type:complete len:281 (-) Transcript_6450:780-1622(-)